MARLRGDRTDAMRGSLRAGPHGWDAVYTLNGELYRSQWFAAEALAPADLATHQDALAAVSRTPVPFHPWLIAQCKRPVAAPFSPRESNGHERGQHPHVDTLGAVVRDTTATKPCDQDGDGPMMAVLLGLMAVLLLILVRATPIGRALVGRAFLVGWVVIVAGGALLLAVYLTSE
jgi:hypothetical protein